MTPEERELRRALEARSGEPSPQFRARLTASLGEGRPYSAFMQVVAMVAVVAITLGTVGVLLLSRNARHVAHQGLASASRLASPSPWISQENPTAIPMPNSAQLSASLGGVVWVLFANKGFYRSTNRGDTWESGGWAPVGYGLKEMSFIDAQQGYLVGPIQEECKGADTEVWHTDNGSASWRWVNAPIWTVPHNSDNVGSPECRQGLSYIDPTHVFISGWADGRHARIYRTVDGGKTWSGVDLPDPPDFQTGPGFSLRAGLVKKFGGTLYVIAWGKQPGGIPDRQYMFRSTDDGATWTWLMKVPSRYLAMVTESRWLMLRAPGQSMESTNGGQQWHPFASDFITDTPVGGPQIVFADSQVGYAEGRGALQRTIDGGLHWVRIATPRGYLPAPTPPTVASSTRTNPSPAASNPSPVALLPVTDPGFRCRLAVGTGWFNSDSIGGFVAVPRGAFERDPAAPTVTGSAIAFDAAYSRWVHTSPEAVSSDGSLYAWEEGGTEAPKLHVTNVADGSDRIFAAGPPQPQDPDLRGHFAAIPVPIGVTKDSVYLTYGGEGLWGVWRLDLTTGSLNKVSGLKSPSYGAGSIWLELTRGNWVGMYSDGDTLAHLDMNTGAVQDWFHRENIVIRYLGFDSEFAGTPWVQAITFTSVAPRVLEIWRVRGPGQADLVLSGQQFSRVITDKHGTWFANDSGVYLYSGGRLQRVSSASVGEVVGPCV